MTETKYKVGTFVYLKQHIKHYHNTIGNIKSTDDKKDYISMEDIEINLRKPNLLMIVEVSIHTCYGGTQTVYTLRASTTDALLKYFEIEVTDDINWNE